LVEVLPKCRPAPVPVSVTYVRSRQISPRVRAFVDWLVEVFESAPGMVRTATAPPADSSPWPVLDSTRDAALTPFC
jgi:LysR family transcriptional regulator for bpeEF and oprC